MPSYKDQMGRMIELDQVPKRIVSLVPSQTELLFDLDLNEKVVGITKFCIHPDEWFRTKTRVGGTKQLDLDQIKKLQPDLIIANKEENVREQIEELASYFPVWISDVNNLQQACDMICSIGIITGRPDKAQSRITKIRHEFSKLHFPEPKPGVCYLIWQKPYMTIGGDTFIHDMLIHAGFKNIFSDSYRYPEISPEQLFDTGCEFVFLSSEPYPFNKKHAEELKSVLPGIKIILVDGEMFSWYGSRLEMVPAYFRQLRNEILSLMHAGS